MPRSSPVARAATGADYDLFLRLFPELAVDDPIIDRAQFERDVDGALGDASAPSGS